jgi:hypothetical protein
LKCAFWQSLLQYDTLWHLRHCLRDSGDLEHCAHVGVAGAEDEEDASGDVGSVVLLLVGAEADDDGSDAMVAEYGGGNVRKIWEVVLWAAHVVMLAGGCAGLSKRLFTGER